MRVVIVDNFDSFTYNIVQLLGELGVEVIVLRNNVTLAELIALNPDRLVISPGPGGPPNDTGVTCEAIESFAGKIPILGICLGHQAIGYVFGAKVISAKRIMHGKKSLISLKATDCPLFSSVGSVGFEVGRYHSLVLERATMPKCLEVIAVSEEDGEIMAIRHRKLLHVYGVQFHPESILTATDPMNLANSEGRRILERFIKLTM